jgi:hypothetical protein
MALLDVERAVVELQPSARTKNNNRIKSSISPLQNFCQHDYDQRIGRYLGGAAQLILMFNKIIDPACPVNEDTHLHVELSPVGLFGALRRKLKQAPAAPGGPAAFIRLEKGVVPAGLRQVGHAAADRSGAP